MNLRIKSALLLISLGLGATSFRLFLARADCPGGGADPGTVLVVGEAPVALQFPVASGTPCKLVYPANVAVWTSPLRTTPVLSNAAFTAGSGPVFGDANGDGHVRLDDLIYIRNRLGTSDAACDLNGNGVVDQNDLVMCRSALGSGPDNVTVYLEAVSASSALCDTSVDFLTDPGGSGSFTVAESRRFTSVAVSVSPASGGLGTPVTITLQPAIAPLAFDSATTATWSGEFQTASGSTPAFRVNFNASELRESGAGSATVFIGQGTAINAPSLEDLSGTGILDGTMSLIFSGHTISKRFSFSLQVSGATWEKLTYPIDYLEWTVGPPALAGEPAQVRVLDWSRTDPDSPPSEEMLLYLRSIHHAAVLRIPETPSAVAAAPEFVFVDIITQDSSRSELDRRRVRLDLVEDDGDPSFIVYSSHLSKPVVLLDVPVDPSAYPGITVLHASDAGYILAVPGTR